MNDELWKAENELFSLTRPRNGNGMFTDKVVGAEVSIIKGFLGSVFLRLSAASRT